MLLIKNADLYDPKPRGACDILVAGGRIVAVVPSGERTVFTVPCGLKTIDAGGCLAMPGIIDRHVHFNGAGGEGGPENRTPPLQLSAFARAGVTTAVGMLGTDGTCRSLEELLMKARGLEAEGISTWILTGSYSLPSQTMTGGVTRDICLIDKVIGLKLAISDHRSSHPTVEEIRRSVSDARVGGILSGKAGCVCVHMGNEPAGLTPLLEAVEGSDIPLSQFAPTHISRCSGLLEQSAAYGLKGGILDITAAPSGKPAFGTATPLVVKQLLDAGVEAASITISSDGNGSMPSFNDRGEMTGLRIGPLDSVIETVGEMLSEGTIPAETVISLVTSNPAAHLKLPLKGRLREGCDGDVLVLDGSFRPRFVAAKGRLLMEDGEVIVKGAFE
ncbi:MAG: beta-aspartyl-peptidase [Synergistaceae bacterium]|nr:beta-aspartyl-peptidase [Synergistota bacterium]NLM72335.1 beta-aspartyl-peptidase [Synergistaceae bacterium]